MSELKIKISGVYLLRIGDRFYVGSSANIKRRIEEHERELKKGKHANPKVQCAYNKHSSISFHVLETCLPEELLKIEQSYLSLLENEPRCLNCNFVAMKPPSFLGKKLSEEAKKKISKARKGNVVHSEYQRKLSSEIHKGNTYRKGALHTEEAKEKMRKGHLGLKLSEETKMKMSLSHKENPKICKAIIQLKDGLEIKKWISATQAAEQLGFSQGLISACCRGERKSHKGFEWRFAK